MLEPVALILLTNGRRPDYLQRTLASAQLALPQLASKTIAADTSDRRTLEWIRDIAPGWRVQPIRSRKLEMVRVRRRRGLYRVARPGYCTAVRKAIEIALVTRCPWIFWLEDDFVFLETVPLEPMQATMRAHPNVAQMSLLRQALAPWEVAHGGVLRNPEGNFVQREGWVEHRWWWTMNPMLTRRETLARFPWPRGPECELKYTAVVCGDGVTTLGVWGQVEDPPRVHHIGDERAGSGY